MNEVTGYQSDSVDHLASEILKERVNRLRQQQENMGEKIGNTSIEEMYEKNSNGENVRKEKDSFQIDNIPSRISKEPEFREPV